MIHSASETFAGNGTNYVGSRLRGRVHAVKVVADSSVTDNFDLTLTGETTEVPILVDATVAKTATTWFYPRVIPNKNTDGSAFTDATADIHVLNERIKVVAANAGATGVITVTVFFDSEE